MARRFPCILLIVYCIYFVVLSVHPYHRAYWLVTNLAPIVICLFFVKTYSTFRFSNVAYLLASVLLFLQTLGAHYFFHRVPFDFITSLFDFERHNFDRLVHFSVGFYAYLFAEYLTVKKIMNSGRLTMLVSFSFIMLIAAFYEIIEWIYLILISPESNADFLGAQGDIWDAQKDMLCDGLGAVFVLIFFKIKNHCQK